MAQSLTSNSCVHLVRLFDECIDSACVDVVRIQIGVQLASVVTMLDVHPSVAAHIDHLLDSLAVRLLADGHVHVEGSVGLCLAVGDAKFLSVGLSGKDLAIIDAI